MPEPRVIKREEATSLERAPGVTVASSVTKEAGATEISSGITTFEAGASNTTHYHNAEESVIVIEGEGILMINGHENQVRQYDAAFIAPGTHHRRDALQNSLVLRHRGRVPGSGGRLGPSLSLEGLIMPKGPCPLCGLEVDSRPLQNYDQHWIECPTCGTYRIGNYPHTARNLGRLYSARAS